MTTAIQVLQDNVTAQPQVAVHGTVAIPAILALSDPVGVLTIYVDADPALAGGVRPAWQAPIRVGLRRLVRDARRTLSREKWIALEARVAELEPELEALLDPRHGSRGRALFAALEHRAVHRVALRATFPPLVQLTGQARVLPLLKAVQDGRAAGVATISTEQLDTAEWELGALHAVETIPLAAAETQSARPATNPAVRQPFPERDRFRSAAGARMLARARETGALLASKAEMRGWDFLITEGDPRLVDALSSGFVTDTCELVQSGRAIGKLAASRTSRAVEIALRERRLERLAQLLGQVDSSRAATRDPLVLEHSLDSGRVEHLLLADSPELFPRLDAESLIRRAFATGAKVTLVTAGSAELGAGGAAALLRW